MLLAEIIRDACPKYFDFVGFATCKQSKHFFFELWPGIKCLKYYWAFSINFTRLCLHWENAICIVAYSRNMLYASVFYNYFYRVRSRNLHLQSPLPGGLPSRLLWHLSAATATTSLTASVRRRHRGGRQAQEHRWDQLDGTGEGGGWAAILV